MSIHAGSISDAIKRGSPILIAINSEIIMNRYVGLNANEAYIAVLAPNDFEEDYPTEKSVNGPNSKTFKPLKPYNTRMPDTTESN